eukprot:TRINITY_DN30650_c0_g1_i1.p1 TRINITY_DN30650_c0_g1~~TRINITY_DN30650_c0_g1_i1.p1  ORF type:complete len:832 (+),score=160.88 TRINITY_DN30650_c0_g1_i1:87-2582(+)
MPPKKRPAASPKAASKKRLGRSGKTAPAKHAAQKRPAAAPSRQRKRPAAAAVRKATVVVGSSARKRPAASAHGRGLQKKGRTGPRLQPFRTEAACERGHILFSETPFALAPAAKLRDAASSTPSAAEKRAYTPLLCRRCGVHVGPLDVVLALAAGYITKEGFLEAATRAEAQPDYELALREALRREAKTLPLPMRENLQDLLPSCLRNTVLVRDHLMISGSGLSSCCFCSKNCYDSAVAEESNVCPLLPSGHCAEIWKALIEHATRIGEAANVLLLSAQLVLNTIRGKTGKQLEHALEGLLSLPRSCSSFLDAHVTNVPACRRGYQLLLDVCQAACPEGSVKLEKLLDCPTYFLLVAAVDKFAWSLSGDTVPSLLDIYCKRMAKPEVPEVAQAEALLALQPVVEKILAADTAGDTPEVPPPPAPLPDGCRMPLLQPPVAQKHKVIILKNVFNAEDVTRMHVLAEKAEVDDHAPTTSGSWRTRYLNYKGAMRAKAPDLLQRLLDAVLEADAGPEGPRLLHGVEDTSKLRPRVVEYHQVGPGGSLPDPTHIDGGSLLTIDVMLSHPGEDFDGGQFCTLESDGRYAQHDFQSGDAVVFVSQKYHCVRPVTRGLRKVMIMELWEGEERHCDHRCQQRWGPCLQAAEEEKEAAEEAAQRKSEAGQDPLASEIEAAAARKKRKYSPAGVELKKLLQSATAAFAKTTFEGFAYYPQIAAIMAQSEWLRQEKGSSHVEANVEVVFELPDMSAQLRSLRALRAGEELVVASYDGDESHGQDSESDLMEGFEAGESEELSDPESSDDDAGAQRPSQLDGCPVAPASFSRRPRATTRANQQK